MTEKMIENRVRKLFELEAQQKELATQADAIRAQLKAGDISTIKIGVKILLMIIFWRCK